MKRTIDLLLVGLGFPLVAGAASETTATEYGSCHSPGGRIDASANPTDHVS
jgi:hypothetical protein